MIVICFIKILKTKSLKNFQIWISAWAFPYFVLKIWAGVPTCLIFKACLKLTTMKRFNNFTHYAWFILYFYNEEENISHCAGMQVEQTDMHKCIICKAYKRTRRTRALSLSEWCTDAVLTCLPWVIELGTIGNPLWVDWVHSPITHFHEARLLNRHPKYRKLQFHPHSRQLMVKWHRNLYMILCKCH